MKNFNNLERMLLALIFIMVVLRLVNLGYFPIFGDEALYLDLGQRIVKDPSTLFNSISYGVFPLYIWTLTLLRLFVAGFNYFIAGRLLQVVWDLLSAYLIFLIGQKIESKMTGILGSLIYLLLPLNFLHSRLILLESLTNLLLVITLWIIIKNLQDKKINHFPNYPFIFIVGLFLVLAFFTKALAAVSFIPFIFIPIFFNWPGGKNGFNILKKQYYNLFLALGLGGILILVFYLPIAHNFSRYLTKDNSTLFSLLSHLKINLYRSFWWINNYITLPILLVFVLTSIYIFLRKNFLLLWFVFWAICIILINSLFAANYYPRHLYNLTVPVALIVGACLVQIHKFNKHFALICLILLIFQPLILIKALLTNPLNAPLALEDRQQFLEDWTSGLNNETMASKINQLAGQNEITVLTEPDSNQYWEFANLYNIEAKIVPSPGLSSGNLSSVLDQATKINSNQIYLLVNRNPDLPKNWPATLVFSAPKGPHRSINLYLLSTNEK